MAVRWLSRPFQRPRIGAGQERRMMSPVTRKAIQAGIKANVWLYRRTNGRVGGRGMGCPPLLLQSLKGRGLVDGAVCRRHGGQLRRPAPVLISRASSARVCSGVSVELSRWAEPGCGLRASNSTSAASRAGPATWRGGAAGEHGWEGGGQRDVIDLCDRAQACEDRCRAAGSKRLFPQMMTVCQPCSNSEMASWAAWVSTIALRASS